MLVFQSINFIDLHIFIFRIYLHISHFFHFHFHNITGDIYQVSKMSTPKARLIHQNGQPLETDNKGIIWDGTYQLGAAPYGATYHVGPAPPGATYNVNEIPGPPARRSLFDHSNGMSTDKEHIHHVSLISDEQDLIAQQNHNLSQALEQQNKQLEKQLKLIQWQQNKLDQQHVTHTLATDDDITTVTDITTGDSDNDTDFCSDLDEADYHALNEQMLRVIHPNHPIPPSLSQGHGSMSYSSVPMSDYDLGMSPNTRKHSPHNGFRPSSSDTLSSKKHTGKINTFQKPSLFINFDHTFYSIHIIL